MKLEFKELLIIAGIVSMITIVSTFFEVRYQMVKSENTESDSRSIGVFDAVASYDLSMWRNDNLVPTAVLKTLFQSEAVKQAQIVTKDGKILAGLHRAPTSEITKNGQLGDHSFKALSRALISDTDPMMPAEFFTHPSQPFAQKSVDILPVKVLDGSMRRIIAVLWEQPNDGATAFFFGHIIVDYSLEPALTTARHTAYVIIIANIITGGLMVILLALAMRQSIISPVRYLVRAGLNVASGDFNTPIEKIGNSEIGKLAGMLDQMRAKLQDFSENAQKIAEQKTLEVLKQKRVTVEAERLAGIGEMAGGIAHEINNPLAIIQLRTSFMQNVLEREPIDTEELLKNLESLRQASNRIKSTIESLLIFVGKDNVVAITEVLLTDIFDRLSILVRPILENSFVDFRIINVPEGMCLRISPSQFLHLFYHLIKNSSEQLSSRYDGWIRIEFRDVGNIIEFDVTDSGTGISLELAQRIFEPFFTTKTVGSGAGLGLSVCKGIVESYGGQIMYDPNSQNTKFIIRFPKIAVVSKMGTRRA